MLRSADTFLWFDLDDTLWDMSGNSDIALDIIHTTTDTVAAAFPGADGARRWRDVYHRYNTALWERYSAGTIDRATLRLERFALPLQHVGMDRADAVAASRQLDGLYLHHLGNCSGCLPGARELALLLKRRGRHMGIVSNGFREVQYRKLASGGLNGLFDPIVLSDDTGVNKPAPAFFSAALAAAGTDAAHSLIIGDNPDTDIAGALAAGWAAAVWVTPPETPVPPALAPYAPRIVRVASPADIIPML